MPSEPRWSCTIPSIHDDTPLSARIYHPAVLTSANEAQWRTKGIAMAHPYAPMGGSYDDRIVGIVVEEFLKAGWVVGTFNFRGASGGKTSWSGKPELSDYHSFAGFFMHYLSYLRPHPRPDEAFTPVQLPTSPVDATQPQQRTRDGEADPPIVILGGYSYGSLILRHLPPILSILQPFSAADEILLKAHKLADQTNLEFLNTARDHERRRRRGHEAKLSVTMGGEETSPEQRRSSREIRRSLDTSRAHEIGHKLRSLSHVGREGRGDVSPVSLEPAKQRPAIQVPEVRYLLVSPLTAPTSALAAPGLARGPFNRSADEDASIKRHQTFAIFGDQDMFASAKKLRSWVEKMKQDNPAGFSSVEVEGAGHFWFEAGVEVQLRDALQTWEKKART